MSDIAIFAPNPDDVIYQLRAAGWDYVQSRYRSQDIGFAKVSVFPLLFRYVVEKQEIPSLDTMLSYLLQYRDELGKILKQSLLREIKRGKRDITAEELYEKRTKVRAKKLILDFCRELHTFALLGSLGSVSYQKVLDLQYNVDFIVSLSHELRTAAGTDKVGIQSAMRNIWTDDQFTELKGRRRRARGVLNDFLGPVYWLTNRERRYALSVSGVWLFGVEHINDLRAEILRPKPVTSF